MSAHNAKIKREDLIQEIFNTLSQWPEIERRIFTQAHYHGQSREAISRSLGLDIEEVSTILKQCDRQLHTSLREFGASPGKCCWVLTTLSKSPTEIV